MSLQYKLYRVGVEALYAPVIWPSLIVYAFKRRDRVFRADMEKFCEVELHGARPGFGSFWRLMVWYSAFRNVFYYRVGYASILFKFWMKEDKSMRLHTRTIGPGLYIQHGNSTGINAVSIGKNFWINQNCCIGWQGKGHPTIGDNVRVGVGAIVLGGITIGDNVNIGANAAIVKDVPSNCTVIGNPAYIVKRDGVKVWEKL